MQYDKTTWEATGLGSYGGLADDVPNDFEIADAASSTIAIAGYTKSHNWITVDPLQQDWTSANIAFGSFIFTVDASSMTPGSNLTALTVLVGTGPQVSGQTYNAYSSLACTGGKIYAAGYVEQSFWDCQRHYVYSGKVASDSDDMAVVKYNLDLSLAGPV